MTKSKRIHYGGLSKSIAGLAPKVCLLLFSMLLCSCYGMRWYIRDVEPKEIDLHGYSLYSIFGNDISTCTPEERRARLKKDPSGMTKLKSDDIFYFLMYHDNDPEPRAVRDRKRYAKERCLIPPGSTGKIIKKGFWNCSPLYKVEFLPRTGYWVRITPPDGASFNAFLPLHAIPRGWWYSGESMLTEILRAHGDTQSPL